MKGKYNFAQVMIDSIDDATREQIQGFLNHPAFGKRRIAIMPVLLRPEHGAALGEDDRGA